MPSSREIRVVALALCVVGIAVVTRVLHLWAMATGPGLTAHVPGLDVDLFHRMAARVAGGDLWLGDDVYHFAPLYAYVLGAVYVVFGESEWVARVFNVALGAGAAGLAFELARRLFRSLPVAVLTGLGVAFYAPFVVIDTSRGKASLGHFLLAASLCVLARPSRATGPKYGLVLGALLGGAAGVLEQAWVFVVGVVAMVAVGALGERGEGRSRHVLAAAAVLVGVLVAVAPFLWRNLVVTGQPSWVSAQAGLHVWMGNRPGASGTYERIEGVRAHPRGHFDDARALAEKDIGRALSAGETSAYWLRKTIEAARDDPAALFETWARKLVLLGSPYELPSEMHFGHETQRLPHLAYLPGFAWVAALGLIGLAWVRPWHRMARPLVVCLGCFALALILTIVNWRYRLPVVLAMMPFSAFALVGLWREVRQGRLVPASALGAAVVGLVVLGQLSSVGRARAAADLRHAEASHAHATLVDRESRGAREVGEAVLRLHRLGAEKPQPPPKKILLLSVDTTRADRLSAYGYSRPTSPNIEALARTGVRFARAYCPMPLSDPSHTTFFTGQHPRTHGVVDNGDLRLKPSAPSLASRLQERGYRTAAITARVGLDPEVLGLRGFDFVDAPTAERGTREAKDVLVRAARWLDSVEGESWFLWVHLWEPHDPYAPEEPYRGTFVARADEEDLPAHRRPPLFVSASKPLSQDVLRRARDLYDAEVAAADAAVGRLLELVEEAPPTGSAPLVVLVSDHGESLGERLSKNVGFGHGPVLHEEALRVPWVLSWPGVLPPQVVETPVSTVDLAPTVLDLVGAAGTLQTEGRSLAAELRAGRDPAPRPIVAERRPYPTNRSPRLRSPQLAWIDHPWKLFLRLETDEVELYHLERDPGEQDDLASREPERVESMRAMLLEWSRAHPILSQPQRLERRSERLVRAHVRKALVSLGYVDRPVEDDLEASRPAW